jgi:hypothetical protein
LVLDGSEPIFGIILGSTDQIEELAMKFRCCGGNNLEIGKQSVGLIRFDGQVACVDYAA